ncbi:MAG TPA: sigma-70 family RNA polymerase sigma factor [Myxococcota bacterium]|nr:sigma-70 family RNA polymerase sigma factor [Myxococcota bacterium]HQK52376.1 sigma-70 family RNA polymerase sigma factor [Myxococcota bacterium]
MEPLERDLVLAAKRGDRKAFQDLAQRYYGRIYRMLLALTHREEEAQDLAQETFVRALQGIGSFQMGSGFYTWLYRIAHNVFVDRYRQQRNQRETSDYEDGRKVQPALGAETDSRPLEPSRMVEAQERLEVVRQAMALLKPEHQEILVLREVEGLSYEEISETLGLKMGTVMSRLFHARMRLREVLEARLGRHG